ncbi:MAG: SpoIIE family protein phosphatase [Candidatus Brocadiia bacterium]
MKNIEEVRDRGFGELLDHVNAGLYVTDTERRIVYWNKAAERITGHRREDVVGSRCADDILAHVDKDGRLLCTTDLCPLHRAMVRGKPGDGPVTVYAQTRRGKRIPLSTTVGPVLDDEGHVIGGIEVFRDQTQELREMELARTVQRQLLTADLPQGEGLSFAVQYAPFSLIGGDSYQVRRVSEGRYEAFLSDAEGHGPSAALYTTLIYGLLMECRPDADDPGALLSAINRRMAARAEGLGFFTAVCVHLDASEGRMLYSSAGHPPLLLQRGETNDVEILRLSQLPIGVHEEADYENMQVQLAPGDRVLAYSDGVTDVPVGDDKRLGADGLAELLRQYPTEGGHRLEDIYGAVLERCQDVEPDDDLTLLSCLMLPASGEEGTQ